MFSVPEKITLIFNLRAKQFPASFRPYYRELPRLDRYHANAGASVVPPPLRRTRQTQVAAAAAEQQVQLTRHIKTHFLTTPNASLDCSRLGQSQVKIVQPIVFQSLQTACQVLFGQVVREADNRGWKRTWQFPAELQRAVMKCNSSSNHHRENRLFNQ